MEARHEYKMGIIGNCSYMSYIDDRANVVWQCWPYFDSSFIFGGLISKHKGGEFSITPTQEFTSKQYYLTNTNILVTEFEASDGKYRVIDFAPRFELYERFHRPLMLFRKIEVLEGSPQIKVICQPMDDYGDMPGRPIMGSNSINYEGMHNEVRLTTSIARAYIYEQKPFSLTRDYHLVLSFGQHLEAPLEKTYNTFFEQTQKYWRKWVRRTAIPSIYQEEVIRSVLLLKLHQYEDTGAIIAAGTTSLPEHPGTERNWDYRYCWIRDSYFTLKALTDTGHFTEAEKYAHWIQNIVQEENGHYQPVYTIMGDHKIEERILDLEGYMNHGPVRVGNEAYLQKQHDVYGQMILSLMPLYTDLRIIDITFRPSLQLIHKILDKIEAVMESPDAGIWEFRGKMQSHAGTYLFHWAGAKAAVKIAQYYEDQEMLEKATTLMEQAGRHLEECYDHDKEVYGMAKENKKLNASEFLLVNMGFITNKEKAIKHIRALETELKTKDNLIYRYRDLDDFGETHSTFLICGFWYAQALIAVGEIDKARTAFDSLLKRANHLGIFSEDIDPQDGSQYGNIAQTYSHVGLINTAFSLDRTILSNKLSNKEIKDL